MSRDSSITDQAITATLLADAQLQALLPDGVYWDVPPPGPKRFTLLSLVEHDDVDVFDGAGAEEALYLVKAVVSSKTGTDANAGAARIHDLLQDRELVGAIGPQADYGSIRLARASRVRYTEVDEVERSVRYQHCGGRYGAWSSVGLAPTIVSAPAEGRTLIMAKTVTLTHADILALKDGVPLLPAPPAGSIQVLMQAVLTPSIASPGYGNFTGAPDPVWLAVQTPETLTAGPQIVSTLLSDTTFGGAQLTTFLTNLTPGFRTVLLPYAEGQDWGGGTVIQASLSRESFSTGWLLQIAGSFGNDNPLTGGAADDTIAVDLIYALLPA